MRTVQHELPVAGEAFNLAGERGVDIDRVLAEERARLAAECAAKEYAAKMQRSLAECPGLIGVDAFGPSSPANVAIDPRQSVAAMIWLKRRFHVAETIELSTQSESLHVEVMPRKHRSGRATITRPRFGKIEQFTFTL
jgi:hypothetical protein